MMCCTTGGYTQATGFSTVAWPPASHPLRTVRCPDYIFDYGMKGDGMAKKDYYTYEEKEEKPAKKPGIFSKVDKWKLFKQVVSMAASGCATMVISRYLKANMPESENMFEKATMAIGMYCITGIVGTKVADYTSQELDSWRESVTKEPLLEEGDGDDGTD